MPELTKILAGRKAVEACRTAHTLLHSKPWHKGVPEEHTPLLVKLVDALDKLGFTSIQADFELRKTEILAKFWDNSKLMNIKELGFKGKDDFDKRATDKDREALRRMWL